MIKMYFLCCAYRTRIKDHGIIKLRIAGLDKQISDLRSKIIDFIETRTKNNELISADLLKAHINGECKETKGLLDMIRYYIDTNKGRLSIGTVKQYISIHSKMSKYLNNELLVPDYPLNNLNYRFLNDYRIYFDILKNTLVLNAFDCKNQVKDFKLVFTKKSFKRLE